MEFGGAISGEHGDGRARAPSTRRVFGPTMSTRPSGRSSAPSIPRNLLNPGNIVDSPGDDRAPPLRRRVPDLGARRRCSTSRRRAASRPRSRCATASASAGRSSRGRCAPRTWPRATRSTPRAGRANALRAVLSGKAPAADFTGQAGSTRCMDLCLECKGCKAECPANVDMAKLKYEFLHHYYGPTGCPLRNRLFGRIAPPGPAGLAPGPALQLDGRARPPNRWLMERVAGIDRRRPLPAFARETFTDWFDRPPARADGTRGDVVLFHDTFITYNSARGRPRRRRAAGGRRLPRRAGGPEVLRPAHDLQGHAGRGPGARRVERGAPGPGVARGAAIVGLEPSCLLTLRDEYVELVRTDEARGGGALELAPGGVPPARAARAASAAFARPARRAARRCSTATATRRPWSAPRPPWPCSSGRATR